MSEVFKKTVCIDFDGVIHRYNTGWKGPTVIPDGIVEGAVEAIAKLAEKYEICIYTTRANTPEGKNAVVTWLNKQNVKWDRVDGKPIAVAYIDDRAIVFRNGVERWSDIIDRVNDLSN